MKQAPALFSLALSISILMAPGISPAADLTWPEAVNRLARERSEAVNCAGGLKAYGTRQDISKGQLVYGEAKANFDGVISGLITVLSEDRDTRSLPSLESDLQQGAAELASFCKSVNDLLQHSAGEKDIFADIVKEAIQPVVNHLSEGVAALYNNHRKDDALTIETIKTQLEAAKWPDFAEVKSVK